MSIYYDGMKEGEKTGKIKQRSSIIKAMCKNDISVE